MLKRLIRLSLSAGHNSLAVEAPELCLFPIKFSHNIKTQYTILNYSRIAILVRTQFNRENLHFIARTQRAPVFSRDLDPK